MNMPYQNSEKNTFFKVSLPLILNHTSQFSSEGYKKNSYFSNVISQWTGFIYESIIKISLSRLFPIVPPRFTRQKHWHDFFYKSWIISSLYIIFWLDRSFFTLCFKSESTYGFLNAFLFVWLRCSLSSSSIVSV